MNRIAQRRGRAWKLGCVAVNFTVNDSGLELAA
jgi:hypothetical protein